MDGVEPITLTFTRGLSVGWTLMACGKVFTSRGWKPETRRRREQHTNRHIRGCTRCKKLKAIAKKRNIESDYFVPIESLGQAQMVIDAR